MLRSLLFAITTVSLVSPTLSQVNGDDSLAFQAARELDLAGKRDEAFMAFAKIPGAHHVATRIGRASAQDDLKLLDQHRDEIPTPLAQAIAADLWLSLGENQKARECVAAVAKCTSSEGNASWGDDRIPADAYLAAPPAGEEAAHFTSSPLNPFHRGPGSHRDNWLIRRQLALKMPNEAVAEYARVWEIHRRRTKPYIVDSIARYDEGRPVHEKRLIAPVGFDGRGLQFALDYAFFIKRQGNVDESLAILREALLPIDMDRNPNNPSSTTATESDLQQYPFSPMRTRAFGHVWGGSAGVSRKEFIRLAYGAMKDVGKEGELIDQLTRRIEAGDNRFRRVLARIRFHEGDVDGAVVLEEAYVREAGFDALTSAYRLGRIYEDAGRNEQAIAQYERISTLSYEPPKLPDSEEVTHTSQMQQARAFPIPFTVAHSKLSLQADVAGRLRRLYGAAGEPKKAFRESLKQFEASPTLFDNLALLEEAKTQGEVAQTGDEFSQWLTQNTKNERLSDYLPAMQWVLKDYEASANALAEQWRPRDGAASRSRHSFDQWQQRFAKLGDDKSRMFLTKVLEADPGNPKARLELLDLRDSFEGPEVVAMLESLLDGNASFAFQRGKGDYNRTRFRNYFDLAYRLLRIYEREKRFDKLQTLGLQIAAGHEPFGQWWVPDRNSSRLGSENELEEDVGSCLSLLIQRGDEATFRELQTLWKTIGDCPAQRQLARRLAGTFAHGDGASDFGWANAPKGVRLIASNSTVLSLARDDRYLYCGHPWGIAVYTHAGDPVTRVALAEAAQVIAVKDATIWVGTPIGLFRIDRDGWACTHLYLHGDVPERSRRSRSSREEPANYWSDNRVNTLALDGDDLWIGTHRNVQRLNTKTLALRAYSSRELKIERGIRFERILPDDEYVWVAGNRGLRRYNRRTDTFSRVDGGQREVGLVAKIDGILFGHIWLNDKLRNRPCIIDRETLAVTPILIETEAGKKPPELNGPFSFYGTYQGRLAFGDGHAGYVYNAEIGKLQRIGAPWDRPKDPIDTILPGGFRTGDLWWPQPIRSAEMSADVPLRKPIRVHLMENDRWTLLALPDGSNVAGMRNGSTTRYRYPSEDKPYDFRARDRRHEGGLVFVTRESEKTAVNANPHGDVIPGDRVFMAVASDEGGVKSWLCTDLGLATLDSADRVQETFTRRDGLCGNRIPSAVAFDGRLFFGSSWGDHGGGLIVADPATGVFTSYFQSDGLGTDKIARLEKEGGNLRVIYDIEYSRGNSVYDYRQFGPTRFDPATGVPVDRAVVKYLPQPDTGGIFGAREGVARTLAPCLGGFVIREQYIVGKKYICGTRGLAILDAYGPIPTLAFDELEPQLTVDPHITMKAFADSASIRVNSFADFAEFVASDNPYLRNRAIMGVQHLARTDPEPFLPALRQCTHDELAATRAVAARLLGEICDGDAVDDLRRLLSDEDRAVREEAAIALFRIGGPVELDLFQRILTTVHDASRQTEAIRAFAQDAKPEVFTILLKHPLHVAYHEEDRDVYTALGNSLLKYPAAAELLLKAYNQGRDSGPESNYGPTRFAQEVFKYAGKRMLPVLHKALESDDRVVRSNAARACGAIKHASSIGPLLAALNLESGLSRASIVWALGQLKAEQALPRLAELYVDARNDERRGRHTGYRFAQSAAQMQSQFEAISRFDAIGTDFDELSQIAEPTSIQPRKNEPLLNPDRILQAVRNIGPESSQEFYRTLAGGSDVPARSEAAVQLAEGSAQDGHKNLPILRNLLADGAATVRTAAAVSLLLLGESDSQKPILQWLSSTESYPRQEMLKQLKRVNDGSKLTFARSALERYAAAEKQRNEYQYRLALGLLERIAKSVE